jgi:hypothetical protein
VFLEEIREARHQPSGCECRQHGNVEEVGISAAGHQTQELQVPLCFTQFVKTIKSSAVGIKAVRLTAVSKGSVQSARRSSTTSIPRGSFGLSTTLQTSAGVLKAGTAPRFTTAQNVPQSLLPPAPAVGFPAIPVRSGPTSGAIYWSQDSAIKTPYAHVIDFSIACQVRNGSSLATSGLTNPRLAQFYGRLEF